MPIRQIRLALNFVLVILATLAAKHLFDNWRTQETSGQIADQIITLSELPALPDGLTIHYADITRSEDPEYVDTQLTLTGPTDILDSWLDQVDGWEKKRPGVILNYQLRESEMSSRIDFSAEIYLKPKS